MSFWVRNVKGETESLKFDFVFDQPSKFPELTAIDNSSRSIRKIIRINQSHIEQKLASRNRESSSACESILRIVN